MVSVTSEASASASFQAAQPKPARADRSPQNDNFGALLDSSLPAETGAGTSSAAQPISASQRRADDVAASGGETRSRGTANERSDDASAGQSATNASDNSQSNAGQASGSREAGDAGTNTAVVQRLPTKSGQSKDSSAQQTEKPSSEKASSADPGTSAPQGGAPAATPAAVAVTIPVAIALTDSPAVPSATGSATAPLAIAIAAAAVAAGASPALPPVLPAGQTNIISDAAAETAPANSTVAAADIAPVVIAPNAATAAGPEEAALVEAAGQSMAAPIKQDAAQTDAAPLTDGVFTAAAAMTAAGAPKPAPPKGPIAAPAKATPDAKSGAPDRSPTGKDVLTVQPKVEQPAAVKPDSGADVHERTKSDGAAANAAAPVDTVPVRDHSLLAAAAHPPTDSPEAGTQATAAMQPALVTGSAAAAPAASLSVAAGNPLVPLSGLAFEIAASAGSGKSRFEIRLDPADLGRIDVRIDVDRTGQVTSHLTVEKPETLSMLRQDAPQLQRALDDAGFKTGDGGLQFSLRDQSSSGNNTGNDTGRNAQRLVITDEDSIPAAVAGRTYGRVLGSSSGVDIRV